MHTNMNQNGRRAVLQTLAAAGAAAIGRADDKKMSSNSLLGPNPVVETSSGKVKGFNDPGVAAFLGIPYGASTTGANRFRPPVKRGREDYSPHGNAWEYLPHDHARSRAYRWGEDGIAGISDVEQRLCFSVAMWNGNDAIIKERLFGLTNSEGNHGEDVKEMYYYLDATPTHSYLKMLYKYPQRAYPYAQLLEENRRRGIGATEFEIIDTDAFQDDRYFDVFIEYAQATANDLLIQIDMFLFCGRR